MVKKVIVIILLVVFGLGMAAGAGGSYYFWQKSEEKSKQADEKQKKVEELEKKVKKLEEKEKKRTEEKQAEEYAGWLTYINKDVGYKLKYPSDWTVEETNTTSEVTGQLVKCIKIKTPDKQYLLSFGLKKKTDTFSLSDRTGTGAGDLLPAGTITILKTSTKIEKLVFENKIKEYFYPGAGAVQTTFDGLYEFTANFSYNGELISYEDVDLTDLAEVKTAEKILRSIELL